jgi:thymidine kinase
VSLPQLTIFTGPMFGSKTTRLIAACERYQRRGLAVKAFKPSVDKRFGDRGLIKSHGGLGFAAECVRDGAHLQRAIDDAGPLDVVAVDELFMISGGARVLIQQFRAGVSVVVSSIQMSAHLEPFEELQQLLPWGTEVHVCSAICMRCGQDAYFTSAKFDMGSDTVVGGAELYEPLCHVHFEALRNGV